MMELGVGVVAARKESGGFNGGVVLSLFFKE